jgi:hypothetical protein
MNGWELIQIFLSRGGPEMMAVRLFSGVVATKRPELLGQFAVLHKSFIA